MKGHEDERMIRELADHLEDLYQAALSSGASEAEAEAAVLEGLGDPETAAGELVGAEPAHFRSVVGRWAEGGEEDLRNRGGFWTSAADRVRGLRVALRSLITAPLFTGVSVLVLSIGIGATITIVTLVNAIVLSPLPFDEADRLVSVQHAGPNIGVERWVVSVVSLSLSGSPGSWPVCCTA